MDVVPTCQISVVVPVLNSMNFLPRVVPALMSAGRVRGDVEFIFVDNGSTDGSLEYLRSLAGEDVEVHALPSVSISALRNLGAKIARGHFLSFVDADCLVDDSYFGAAVAELARSGAAATGHKYDLPDDPGWIERAWHNLHYPLGPGDRSYLNAGNFFIRREAFDQVAGFREDLWTGEDAELGQRLTAAGERISAHPSVRARHLGNPKSIRQFFRREVWHGVGMLGTVGWAGIDKPFAMLILHILASMLGVSALFVAHWPVYARVAAVLASQGFVPLVTVSYRLWHTRRTKSFVPGIFLYWIYYWARARALAVVITGGAGSYRK